MTKLSQKSCLSSLWVRFKWFCFQNTLCIFLYFSSAPALIRSWRCLWWLSTVKLKYLKLATYLSFICNYIHITQGCWHDLHIVKYYIVIAVWSKSVFSSLKCKVMHQGAWKSNQTVNWTEGSCRESMKFLSCTAVERGGCHCGDTTEKSKWSRGAFNDHALI